MDNKTLTAKAISSNSKAMVNSSRVMGKTHMASSLRTKVRTKNITRSIMTATHRQQGMVASNRATAASNSNTVNNRVTAANNSSTGSTTRANTPAPEDLELAQMAPRRETEGY